MKRESKESQIAPVTLELFSNRLYQKDGETVEHKEVVCVIMSKIDEPELDSQNQQNAGGQIQVLQLFKVRNLVKHLP